MMQNRSLKHVGHPPLWIVKIKFLTGDSLQTGLLLRLGEKNFKISEYLAKLQARTWLSCALCVLGQRTAKRRRKCTVINNPMTP